MPEKILKFTVTVLEDLHTGTGEGRLGIIDDLHRRDEHGWPVIDLETWNGLVREAGDDWFERRELLKAGETTGDRERLNKLLGWAGDGQGMVSWSSLRLTAASKERTEANPNQSFLNRASSAREVHRRHPSDETLRTIEFSRAGLLYEGEARFFVKDQAEAQKYESLLESCMSRVSSVGGSKSRGWGRIQLSFEPSRDSDKTCSSILKSKLTEKTVEADCQVRLRLKLRNVESLSLASTAQVGNFVGTQSFIGGGRLRGGILSWLRLRDESVAESLADPKNMQCTNAYAVPMSLQNWQATRIVPIPLSIRAPKSGVPSDDDAKQKATTPSGTPWWAKSESTSANFGAREERDTFSIASDSGRIEDERIKTEDYLAEDENGIWVRCRPRIRVHMRNRVPTSRVGRKASSANENSRRDDALFSIEMLDADQAFVCDLIFRDVSTAKTFCETVGELFSESSPRSWIPIGRGRRPVEIDDFEWSPVVKPVIGGKVGATAAEQTGALTVVLTSDLIIRNDWLEFITQPDVADWTPLLAAALSQTSFPNEGIRLSKALCESEMIYGFNTASGLPRVPAIAVKRGSVFRFKSDKPDVLKSWTEAFQWIADYQIGLGERTAEGFGRVAVNCTFAGADPAEETQTTQPAIALNWREVVLGKVESALAAIMAEQRRQKPNNRLSATQWQVVRNITNSTVNIDNSLTQQEEIATGNNSTIGGRIWAPVLPALRELCTEIRNMTSCLPSSVLCSPDDIAVRYALDELAQMAINTLRSKRRHSQNAGAAAEQIEESTR